MTAADNVKVLNAFLAAYNAHNAEAAASFYAEDAVLEVEGVSPPVRGRAAIRDMFRTRFETEAPDIRGKVLDEVADGDRVFSWVEYSYTGIPRAGLNLEVVQTEITPRHVVNRFLERITLRDGKIAHEYAAINMLSVMQQMGLEPPQVLPNAPEAAAREFYAAYAAKDSARLAAACTNDCVVIMPDLRRLDLAAYTSLLNQQWGDAVAGETIRVLDVVARGSRAVVEWMWAGTLKQELYGLAAGEQHYEVPVLTVMEIRDGKVARAQPYLNMALMAPAAAPASGGTAR